MAIEETTVRMSKRKVSAFRLVLVGSLLAIFLGVTDPTTLPPVLLLVPFVLLYLLLYEVFAAFIVRRKKTGKVSYRYRKVITASLAALGVLLLLLSSLNQLSVIDVIVILTLFAGVFFYLRYVDFF